MKQKLFAIALFLLPVVASASEEQVVIDGTTYSINTDEKTATLEKSNDAPGDIVIPETIEHEGVAYTVVSIGRAAFESDKITSVVIPNTIKNIGTYAFEECTELTAVYIPASVTEFRYNAFYKCTALTSIKVDEANPAYDSRNDCNAIIETASNKLIVGCLGTVIPEGVTIIGEDAFKSLTTLTSIKLPESLITIEKEAFESTSLSEVIIPDNVELIDQNAFCHVDASLCILGRKLAKIGTLALSCHFTNIYCYAEAIPETEDGAFLYDIATYKTVLHVPEAMLYQYKTTYPWSEFISIVALKDGDPTPSNPTMPVEPDPVEIDGMYYKLYDTNQAEVTYSPTPSYIDGSFSGDIVIPASVSFDGKNYDVTSIGMCAFEWCYKMTSITIPESVTSIGDAAFKNCESLTSVTLPNSVTSIGKEAFRECTQLTSINIPDNVTAIENGTFNFCKSLNSITIPDGVTYIGNAVFEFCESLTSLTIPGSVTYIGEDVFDGSGITSIIIPDNVTEIRKGVFKLCYYLQSVTLGKGVKEISRNSFLYCPSLTDVYCLAEEVPVTDSHAFEDTDLSVATLHVPEGSIDNYRNTEPWNQFGSIVALTEEGTGIRSINGDRSSDMLRFSLDGKRLNGPHKGLNIIKTRDGQTRKILVK